MTPDLADRPQDVGEKHGGESDGEQERYAPSHRIAAAREQRHTEREHQDAAERNVDLAPRVLEPVDFAARGGRVNDQEPEEGAIRPARTTVQVAGLPLPGALVEIEVIAAWP